MIVSTTSFKSATDSASDEAVLASNKMLTAREGFSDWKSKMQMHALAKCDGHARIFFNAGATPAERAEYTGLSATYRRKWDVASTTIFGEIGMHTRAAVSTNSLPLGVAVEIDAIFELN